MSSNQNEQKDCLTQNQNLNLNELIEEVDRLYDQSMFDEAYDLLKDTFEKVKVDLSCADHCKAVITFIACLSHIEQHQKSVEKLGILINHLNTTEETLKEILPTNSENKLTQIIFSIDHQIQSIQQQKQSMEQQQQQSKLYYFKAWCLFALGNDQESLISLEKSLNKDDLNHKSFNLKALILFKSNDIEQAIKMFNSAIDRNYNNPSYYFNKGICLYHSKCFKEALDCFNLVIRYATDKSIYSFMIARFLVKHQNYEEADGYLDHEHLINSKNPEYHLMRAIVHSKLGMKNENILKHFDKAIEMEPNNFKYSMEKGKFLASINQHCEAVKCFNKSIRRIYKQLWLKINYNQFHLIEPIKNQFCLLSILKKSSLIQLGNFEKALNCIEKSCEINPFDADTHFHRGNCLFLLKRFSLAIESFDRSIELNSNIFDCYYQKGICLFQLKRLQESIQQFDKAIEIDSTNFKCYTKKAKSLYRLERAKAYNKKGLCLCRINKYQDSLDCFNQAIKLDKPNSKYHNNKGEALLILQNDKEALKSFEQALEHDRSNTRALINKGKCCIRAKHIDEGVDCLNRAIDLKRNDPKNLTAAANCLFEVNSFGEASKVFKLAIELSPNNADLHFKMGLCQFQQNNVESAIECFQEAIRCNPNNLSFDLNMALALCCIREYKDASNIFQKSSLKDSKQTMEFVQNLIPNQSGLTQALLIAIEAFCDHNLNDSKRSDSLFENAQGLILDHLIENRLNRRMCVIIMDDIRKMKKHQFANAKHEPAVFKH